MDEEMDIRLQYIFDRVFNNIINTKQSWNNFLSDPKNVDKVLYFLDNENVAQIFFVYSKNGSESVNLQISFTSSFTLKKGIAFFKKLKQKIMVESSMSSQLYFEELAPVVVDTLELLINKVFIPIVTNRNNQKNWPRVIREDVSSQFSRFSASLSLFKGKVEGTTVLPIPITKIEKNSLNRNLIHTLESTVLEWINEVKKVINLQPHKIFDRSEMKGDFLGTNFEIIFWLEKKKNLENLKKQLGNPKIVNIINVLRENESANVESFDNLIPTLEKCLTEAKLFYEKIIPIEEELKKINKPIEKFSEFNSFFPPLLEKISQFWMNVYCHYGIIRLISLFRQTLNDIIRRISDYIEPKNIYLIDPYDAIKRITLGLEHCIEFKSLFYKCREKINVEGEAEEKKWNFDREIIFKRFNLFIDRLKDVLDIVLNVNDFNNIEKVKLGGILGGVFEGMIKTIEEEFQVLYESVQMVSYDILDITDDRFEKDYYNFCKEIQDYDKRLCFIINKSISVSSNIKNSFKILESFQSQIRRNTIKSEVYSKYLYLMGVFDEDLSKVYKIFNSCKENPPLICDLPVVSSAISWCKSLMCRIEFPYSQFLKLESSDLKNSSEMKVIEKKYTFLMKKMQNYINFVHKQWIENIDSIAQEKLKMNIWKRNPDNSVEVNFAHELSSCIEEVKYLGKLGKDVPQVASEIFVRGEDFRLYIQKLQRIINQYNIVLKTVTDVEKPLIEKKLKIVDEKIEIAFSTITWNSTNIQSLIENEGFLISDLYERLNFLKANVRTIQKMINSWMNLSEVITSDKEVVEEISSYPKYIKLVTFWRNPSNSLKQTDQSLTNKIFSTWNRKTSLVIEKPSDVIDQSVQIHKIVQTSLKKIEADENSQEWKNYLIYLDDLIEKGLIKASVFCFKTLIDHFNTFKTISRGLLLNNKQDDIVLMRVDLEFINSNVEYKPNYEEIEKTVIHWINRIFGLSFKVKKLNSKNGETFSAVTESSECKEMKNQISKLFKETIDKMKGLIESFLEFSFLWEENPQENIEKLYAEQMAEEIDIDQLESVNEDEDEFSSKMKTVRVPTKAFAQQIVQFVELYEKIRNIDDTISLGWIVMNQTPAKNALSTISLKWKQQFLEHLKECVSDSLEEFYEFVEVKGKALQQSSVSEGDYPALKELMKNLIMISDREEFKSSTTQNVSIDDHFEPLKEIVLLLKKYDVVVGKRELQKLEEAPSKWKGLMKGYYLVKEKISIFQNVYILKISAKENDFDESIRIFNEIFLREAPFNFNVKVNEAYEKIDKMHFLILEKEKELKSLRKKQKLFELIQNSGSKIIQCRTSLRLLKKVWDIVSMVVWQIEDWKSVPFLEVNIEEITDQTKIFLRELKNIDVKAKRWDVFTGIETMLKNFSDTLPLIVILRSPGLRNRHWNLLMEHTKVKFELSKKFLLSDLLSLSLHKYSNEVEDIVNRSNKELVLEKQLNEFENTWSNNKFEFKVHKQDFKLISIPEETIEILEDDQVNLQNILSQRFIEYFSESIEKWQISLGNVDQIVGLLLQVQKNYLYLENIFMLSTDIRDQLPEDAKRFDKIHLDLKEVIMEAEKEPKILNFCQKKQLEDQLKLLQKELDLCENKLTTYLEEKRKVFPRFYFVSVLDLLNILSKGGQNPHLIEKHFCKLFQSVKKIVFKCDENGPTNVAVGMVSIEGEKVDFLEEITLEGKVEEWLIKLKDHIQKTLRGILQNSINDYSEMGRQSWILQYPTQIVLTTSQIYWNNEVLHAFESLEENIINSEHAMKDYHEKLNEDLKKIIKKIQQNLEPLTRRKLMNLITIDVHSKDIVGRLISEKIMNNQSFTWQSQLRIRWDEEQKDCFIDICDTCIKYGYEYLGNRQRLVITPLTDRIYITLTQALSLKMGGAPAGPAGTGKTETCKDLGNQVAIPVYIFNCSEAMDNKSLGDIFKGLASSGSWGCFDEFNRIAIDVLSVVATQFKTMLDALRSNETKFIFEGDEINLNKRVGVFVTMNPGYLGRTELPENIKALFRPVTVVKPDFELICENMLMAEGFINARYLSKKFITLYLLSTDLLSKSDHYDWGLRAVKQVLNVAGSLKREDEKLTEEQVLFRALRDFNLPKIILEDKEIFMGLLGDIFPNIQIERKKNISFEENIANVLKENDLQPEPNLVLKIVQLSEILRVRHSVFIIGKAGTGKSVIWKTLAKTLSINKKKRTIVRDINPKSVSTFELFGKFSANKEWKDGLLSCTMRELCNIEDTRQKWIIFDGDLDTGWIESMNSVMDDNKLLTLANNDRIPLLEHMRLIFEISHLKFATPATVSRAGILYVSEKDIGWSSFVASWINKRSSVEQTQIGILFDRYVGFSLEHIEKNYKHIIPLSSFNLVTSLCNILEGLIQPKNMPKEVKKDLYEYIFVFACVWAFGGCLTKKDKFDYQKDFSRWWRANWKFVKFPDDGTVFDYYFNASEKKFEKWSSIVPEFKFNAESPLSQITVPTEETVRLKFWLDTLVELGKPFMFVGNSGCGKTNLVQQKLSMLDKSKIEKKRINFNYYTDSKTLQGIMENFLVKKGGKRYCPEGNKHLIFFIDDFNIPKIDMYGTQSPMTLLRQYLDYKHWYNRGKWDILEVEKVRFITCMNPTAGSFVVNPRLQRHFTTFAVNFPSNQNLETIYGSILNGYCNENNFSKSILSMVPKVVNATIDLIISVSEKFPKTAINFHYEFNLRHLSNIFEGLLKMTDDIFKTPLKFVRLWIHECSREFGDRLINKTEVKEFNELVDFVVEDKFENIHDLALLKPVLFTNFEDEEDSMLEEFKGHNDILKIINEKIDNAEEFQNLVLFNDAIDHICRISRIITLPLGNALLIGVGGSGKQSLSKLAAFLNGYDVYQIKIVKDYRVENLKEDLRIMYRKAGKSRSVVFLFSDTQIIDEQFLVFINDLLSSGEIKDLFSIEDKDEICEGVKTEMKSEGYLDLSSPSCWKFFIDKVRVHLHTILCFSPVGDLFRIRVRNFPALINSTTIDWYFPWPEEALLNVSDSLIKDLNLKEHHQNVKEFISYSQNITEKISEKYKNEKKKFSYVTPKSFLELNNLFRVMFSKKKTETENNIKRFELGIRRLETTTNLVGELEMKMKKQQVIVNEKAIEADKLLTIVGKEKKKVEEQNVRALKEEENASKIQKNATDLENECKEMLEEAIPMVKRAIEALNTLTTSDLTELKSFSNPPVEVKDVLACVVILKLTKKGKIPKRRDWGVAKKLMVVGAKRFLDGLMNFDKNNIPLNVSNEVNKYIKKDSFDPHKIVTVSKAASGICSWVINIIGYAKVHRKVEPLRIKLGQAKEQLKYANDKLKRAKSKVSKLQIKLKDIQDKFESKNNEVIALRKEAEQTRLSLELAKRLISSLSEERGRWGEGVKSLIENQELLLGDVLLSSAFVSFCGFFEITYRKQLLDAFKSFLKEKNIIFSKNYNPIMTLANISELAMWKNKSLPYDSTSLENACIFKHSERFCLLVDPQLQGIKWVKNLFKENLICVRHGDKKMIDKIEKAIKTGKIVLVENVGESLDASLSPLIRREIFQRGSFSYITLNSEIEYNPNFKIIFHTKLSSPKYLPEVHAETTLLNFTVTPKGLEDQLLGVVVTKERFDLEHQRNELLQKQNEFIIQIEQLEESLLDKLSKADDKILQNVGLIENLEKSKSLSIEIKEKSVLAEENEQKINLVREKYRVVAERGSVLFFLLDELKVLESMYKYSLHSFIVIFKRAILNAAKSDVVEERVDFLVDGVTFEIHSYVAKGLFEKHRLIFKTNLCLKIYEKDFPQNELSFLIYGYRDSSIVNPTKVNKFEEGWISDESWEKISYLTINVQGFGNLARNIEESGKRWKKWCLLEKPEKGKLPHEWKNKSSLQILLIIRALRPDRLIEATKSFIEQKMGTKYSEIIPYNIDKIYSETTPETPIFFILFPGADPIKDVELYGKKLGFVRANKKFWNISLGRGQEKSAIEALSHSKKKGGWVILQNIHLMTNWLPDLEIILDEYAGNAHKDFRVFMSAEPSHFQIPQSLLQNSIKITNEPSQALSANILRAWDNFDQFLLEESSKVNEFRTILYTLCFFHGLVLGRKRFGYQGWSKNYSFSNGDLEISSSVLFNYLETNEKIPWDDLRYIIGNIFYGGHITDVFDRRTCNTYLKTLLNENLLSNDFYLAKDFLVPPVMELYEEYATYTKKNLPSESPELFGLHANAEINQLTNEGENLFRRIVQLRAGIVFGEGSDESIESKIQEKIKQFLEEVQDEFDIQELREHISTKDPYMNVLLQECEKMNILRNEIMRSLIEVQRGLNGELTISEQMDELIRCLKLDLVPNSWANISYPSLRSLSSWKADLKKRILKLESWVNKNQLPTFVWLPGLFHPKSFLTAILQTTARKTGTPLDKLMLYTEVMKKKKSEIDVSSRRDGCFIEGLFLQGASFNVKQSILQRSKLKELTVEMPIIHVRAVPKDSVNLHACYETPVYSTRKRGPTYIFTAQIKTKEQKDIWILEGVALLLDPSFELNK